MAIISFKGEKITTNGNLPKPGTVAPNFTLVSTDLKDVSLSDFRGKNVILSINPSLDTSVCAATARHFNKTVSDLHNTVVLYVTKDLPFAHARFCSVEGIDNVIPLSDFRCSTFSKDYGILIENGALKGLLARAIVVISPNGVVQYTELISEITNEPNYETILSTLSKSSATWF